MTRSALEWLMSRSCQSGWSSKAVPAYPRSSRASPAIRSDRIGLRLWGIALEPFWPAANGSWSSPISVCWRLRISVANRSSEPPRMAIAASRAACRSRWTIWVLTGSVRRPSAASTSASMSGPRWL